MRGCLIILLDMMTSLTSIPPDQFPVQIDDDRSADSKVYRVSRTIAFYRQPNSRHNAMFANEKLSGVTWEM